MISFTEDFTGEYINRLASARSMKGSVLSHSLLNTFLLEFHSQDCKKWVEDSYPQLCMRLKAINYTQFLAQQNYFAHTKFLIIFAILISIFYIPLVYWSTGKCISARTTHFAKCHISRYFRKQLAITVGTIKCEFHVLLKFPRGNT
jgi:hypothetical protein